MFRVIFWPFRMLLTFVGWILSFTGRLVAGILGLTLMIVGGVLCATIVGAFVGVPLIGIGLALFIRALF